MSRETKLFAENQISSNEMSVLECLQSKIDKSHVEVSGTSEVSELSATTGIKDKDEVLRALYTLEGKSFVSPYPKGDLTSQTWQITTHGVKALTMIE
jgi:hypothetical protein